MLTNSYETPALIATAISKGDKKAEEVLFKKYYKPTLYILERKTGDAELAQDLCQEAFCIMLERLRSRPLDEPDKLAGFLHTIAINLHIGEIRKSSRRKTFTNQAVLDVVADASQNQYRILQKERVAKAVRQLVESMDNTRDRKLLYGFFIQEKDKAEICDELDLSLRHFDKVLFRAKQRFRELLTEDTESSSRKSRT
ncbi:MAG: sigma-70 family RNA polymerase sigma factor [Pseudomonadota bacterium]